MTGAFEGLDSEERRRAEELAERFRALGADDPESWAASEVAEDVPQLARFLLLRRLWRDAERWTGDPADWFGPAPEAPAADHPEYPFQAAAQAVRRVLAAGADPADLARMARAIAFETLFTAVHAIDEGYDPDEAEDLPGWVLAEVGPDGESTTGRIAGGLHEDLLTMAPPLFGDDPHIGGAG